MDIIRQFGIRSSLGHKGWEIISILRVKGIHRLTTYCGSIELLYKFLVSLNSSIEVSSILFEGSAHLLAKSLKFPTKSSGLANEFLDTYDNRGDCRYRKKRKKGREGCLYASDWLCKEHIGSASDPCRLRVKFKSKNLCERDVLHSEKALWRPSDTVAKCKRSQSCSQSDGLVCSKCDDNLLEVKHNLLPIRKKVAHPLDCSLDVVLLRKANLIEHNVDWVLQVGHHTSKGLGLLLLHIVEYASRRCKSVKYLLYISELDHTLGNHLLNVSDRNLPLLNLWIVFREFSQHIDTSLCKLANLCCSQIVCGFHLPECENDALHVDPEASGYIGKAFCSIVQLAALHLICRQLLGVFGQLANSERRLGRKFGHSLEKHIGFVLVLEDSAKCHVLEFKLTAHLYQFVYVALNRLYRENSHQHIL